MSTRLPHHFYRIVGSGSANTDNQPQMVTLNVDGQFGQATIKALQKHLGTRQDGTISPVSDSVRELQQRLNANKI